MLSQDALEPDLLKSLRIRASLRKQVNHSIWMSWAIPTCIEETTLRWTVVSILVSGWGEDATGLLATFIGPQGLLTCPHSLALSSPLLGPFVLGNSMFCGEPHIRKCFHITGNVRLPQFQTQSTMPWWEERERTGIMTRTPHGSGLKQAGFWQQPSWFVVELHRICCFALLLNLAQTWPKPLSSLEHEQEMWFWPKRNQKLNLC